MDYSQARKAARRWRPPHSAWRKAWMRALGVKPRKRRYGPTRREVLECMRQRTGARP